MDFGKAVEKIKQGFTVRRKGWNSKNMHIYLEDSIGVILKHPANGISKREYEPVICMFTAQGKHQPGWLASQADILAEDWEIAN